MSAVLSGLRPFTYPPLYQTQKGKIGKFLIDDQEVDQLRIDAVRRSEAIVRDLIGLKDRPAMLSDVLAGPDRLRELLLKSVPFDSAEICEQAAAKLESLLGPEGIVADPRPEFAGGSLSMQEVREIAAGVKFEIEPYRKMRAQLR